MKIYEEYIKEILVKYDNYIFGDIYYQQKSKDYIFIEISYSQTTDEIEKFKSKREECLEIDDEGEAGDIGVQLFEAEGYNFRNNICHGISTDKTFTNENSYLLFFVLLMIVNSKIKMGR